MFEDVHKVYAENLAIVHDEGQNFTYGDLEEFKIKISSVIPSRSLIFTLCDNNIESLAGYYSFIRNKIVPLMLDRDITDDSLLNLCDIYKPSFLWLPTIRADLFNSKDILFSYLDYSLVEMEQKQEYELYPELALLLTTSGSTGSPKLVRISYLNLEENSKSIVEYLSLREDEKAITVLPIHYSFGLSIINSHFVIGATILLTNKTIIQREFWDFFKENKATSLSGVPYTFEILKKIKFFDMELENLKTITQAGGKMNSDLSKEFVEFCERNQKRMFIMYGQTEATARMSYLSPENSSKKIGSIGVAIPGGRFHLIDESGNLINKNNTMGELVYEGRNVSLGYADSALDLKKGDVNEGFLKTGDLATRDEEGFYYIVGRNKRFIKIFGNRVNMDEIENLIKSITNDVACSGSDDNMLIYVVEDNLEDKIKELIIEKTGINFRGFKIKKINRIPRTASGKTSYKDLS